VFVKAVFILSVVKSIKYKLPFLTDLLSIMIFYDWPTNTYDWPTNNYDW